MWNAIQSETGVSVPAWWHLELGRRLKIFVDRHSWLANWRTLRKTWFEYEIDRIHWCDVFLSKSDNNRWSIAKIFFVIFFMIASILSRTFFFFFFFPAVAFVNYYRTLSEIMTNTMKNITVTTTTELQFMSLEFCHTSDRNRDEDEEITTITK